MPSNVLNAGAGNDSVLIREVLLMKFGSFIFATMTFSLVALAQNPITADSPFQMRYASNLTAGTAVINISNSGSRGGVTLQAGTTASVGGSICVNVYAFDPQEEIVSCCSCPVTPNGLASLTVQQDLLSNTLTGITPTSVVIKLLATAPVGGTCNNSAASVGSETPVSGLLAWGTTLHAATGVPAFALTETPFTPARLDPSELARLQNTCGFIAAQGSGFGVCASCRVGGLGAVAQ
jgi:hypothetical protein